VLLRQNSSAHKVAGHHGRIATRPRRVAAKRGLAHARRARNFCRSPWTRPRRTDFGMKPASSPATKWCSRLTGCIPTAQCRASEFPVLQGPQPADLTTDRHNPLRNTRSGGRGAVHARQQGHRFHCQGNLCDVGQFQYTQPIGCTGFWLTTGPLGFLVDETSCFDLGFRFQRTPVRHQTFMAAQHGICPAMV
jgi:hypothetical protein